MWSDTVLKYCMNMKHRTLLTYREPDEGTALEPNSYIPLRPGLAKQQNGRGMESKIVLFNLSWTKHTLIFKMFPSIKKTVIRSLNSAHCPANHLRILLHHFATGKIRYSLDIYWGNKDYKVLWWELPKEGMFLCSEGSNPKIIFLQISIRYVLKSLPFNPWDLHIF